MLYSLLTGLQEQTKRSPVVSDSTVHSDRSAGLMLMCRDGWLFWVGHCWTIILMSRASDSSVSQRKRKPHLILSSPHSTQETRSSLTHLNMTNSCEIIAHFGHVFSKSQYESANNRLGCVKSVQCLCARTAQSYSISTMRIETKNITVKPATLHCKWLEEPLEDPRTRTQAL